MAQTSMTGRLAHRPSLVRLSVFAGLLTASVGMIACDSQPLVETAGSTVDDQPGFVEGELLVHMLDFGNRTEVRHTLRLASGEQRDLVFATTPEVAPGSVVRVWGAAEGDTIRVDRFALRATGIDGVQARSSALVAGTPKPSKRWAFVLVDTGGGEPFTKAAAEAKLFSDASDSIRSYYREVSFGLQDLTGDVIGPLSLAVDSTTDLCNKFSVVANTLGPMITGKYDQYLWYLGSRIKNCDWGGVAQLGTAASPTKHSFYNAFSDCVVLVQEPGHNFGMVHSSALHCTKGGAPVSMIVPEDGECQHDEYGNPFDPMGSGSVAPANRCYHMNGVQKAYEDWLGGCNIVKATSSGTFTIYPLETACDGVQLLQVPLPAPRSLKFPASPGATLQSGVVTAYYVEMRAPVGLDKPLQTPRVFIVAAGDLAEARQRGNPNWLLDMTPETKSVLDAGLTVGKTFVDPAPGGPRITLVSIDQGNAVIRVQLGTSAASDAPGAGTCSDDTPYVSSGAATCRGIAAQSPPATDGGTVTGSNADAAPSGTGGSGAGGSGGATAGGGGTTSGSGGSNAGGENRKTDAATSGAGATTGKPSGGDATMESAGAISGGCTCRVDGHASKSGSSVPTGAALIGLAFLWRRRRRR